MSKIISPTVGRKVWFWPNSDDAKLLGVLDKAQPCDATVLYVHDDRIVNLNVFGPSGLPVIGIQVPLMQDGDKRPDGDMSFAEWMPFQAKAAAREPALDALTGGQHPLKAGIVPLDAQGVAITGSAGGYLGKTAYSERPADTMTISTPPAPMV